MQISRAQPSHDAILGKLRKNWVSCLLFYSRISYPVNIYVEKVGSKRKWKRGGKANLDIFALKIAYVRYIQFFANSGINLRTGFVLFGLDFSGNG